MLLRFIKKYFAITIGITLSGFLAYWFWDAKLPTVFSDFDAKDWMNLANTSATLTLVGIGAWGISSWKSEYKKKEQYKTAINFG